MGVSREETKKSYDTDHDVSVGAEARARGLSWRVNATIEAMLAREAEIPVRGM